ncbi:MAG: hypothetical protein M1503_10260 [Thaumarchaeota archaeon]|nr:hypothetical protein [Nitrososphaerota archaeon]MCL5318625.1 hypothetical protein [Nitrososphaerota archaeon]
MPPIRMRYAGLLGFIVRIVSIFTGFLFIIIVTRRLPEADFGTWVWITRLIGYAVFPTAAISFWATRFVARDFKAAKTSILMALLVSAGATLIYLAISPFAANAANAPLIFFLLAAIQIPFAYIVENLNAIANGSRPEIVSYGTLAYEGVKVALAFLFMAILGRTLTSAIIAVAASQFISILVLLWFLKGHLSGSFDKQLAWRWLKVAWIPLYNGFSSVFIPTFDASIIIGLTGSSLILANYGAAYVMFSIVASSAALASALYPRLLQGGDHKDVTSVINLTTLFAIPVAAGMFIIARPALYLLNPVYADAVSVARIIILYTFIAVINTIFDFCILGTEKVELNVNSNLKDFVKSKLFMLPTINLICGVTYITSLAIVMRVTTSMNLSPVDNAYYWALTQLITILPLFTLKAILAKKAVNFKVPWRPIALYLAASAVMVVTLQLIKFDIPYTPNIYIFVYQAAKLAAAGIIIYFTILYTFDHYFRNLVKTIWSNFRP